VVAISSGMGDLDFVNQLELDVAASYAINKAGMNMAVASTVRYTREMVFCSWESVLEALIPRVDKQR